LKRTAAEEEAMQTIIETPRLRLRPLGEADAPDMERFCGDWDVARMLRVIPHPYPPGMARDYIRRLGAGVAPERAWAIVRRGQADAPLLGVVSIRYVGGSDRVRLGYWLGKPWWGCGYMTEAVAAVIDGVFDEGAAGIDAGVFTDNDASLRVLEKLGFRFDGAAPAHNAARGEDAPYLQGHLERAGWTVRGIERAGETG
jgi:RimJ/RimL family protein N-acetyltransferase